MANLKEIAAALAILSAGTLTISGCKKEETTTPDDVKAADTAETPADGGGDAAADGEASCSGAAEGEAACSGEAAADGAAADGAAEGEAADAAAPE
jgi:hypothetical protein